jgi:hypothetical protein
MARLRKESKHAIKDASRTGKDRSSQGKKSGISKQQILALGGDEHDYDLVKDIEDAGSAEEDVRMLPAC